MKLIHKLYLSFGLVITLAVASVVMAVWSAREAAYHLDRTHFAHQQAGRVFSRERILNAIWSVSEDPLTNIVDVYIGRLRKKLGPCGETIKTIRGAGYRLAACSA